MDRTAEDIAQDRKIAELEQRISQLEAKLAETPLRIEFDQIKLRLDAFEPLERFVQHLRELAHR